MKIGDKLVNLRKYYDLTQGDLAKIAGVSIQAISLFEKFGKYSKNGRKYETFCRNCWCRRRGSNPQAVCQFSLVSCGFSHMPLQGHCKF